MGPARVRRDQVDYADALGDAAKRQILLNVVKLRYGDLPSFVTVSQLVAGYSVGESATLGTDVDFNKGLSVGKQATLDLSGSFSDNPTATYTPVTGRELARILLAPLAPPDLLGLLLAGAPARFVLGLGLHSIGSYLNEQGGPLARRHADPDFLEVIDRVGELVRAGRLVVRLSGTGPAEPGASGRASRAAGAETSERAIYLAFEGSGDPKLDASEQRLRALLGLSPSSREFRVVFGSGRAPDEIRVRTRSMIEVLSEIAGGVQVPDEAVAQGRAQPGESGAPIAIASSRLPPSDAFSSVRYRGQWFYVRDTDFASKRAFSFVMLLFSLAETSKPGQLPILTIPAG